MRRTVLLVVTLLVLVELRPFTVDDLELCARISDSYTDTSGNEVFYNLRTWDNATNTIQYELYRIQNTGSVATPVKLLTKKCGATQFAFSNGTLFFLDCDVFGETQIFYITDLNNIDVKQLTKLRLSVDSFKISGDGNTLVFSMEVYPGMSINESYDFDTERKMEGHAKFEEYSRLFIRRWSEWYNGKFNHLFVSKIRRNGANVEMDEPVDVMFSLFADCPTRPFGGVDDFDIASDGSELALTTMIGDDMAWKVDWNIYLVSLAERPFRFRCITCDNKAIDNTPLYSPNGRFVAFLSSRREKDESDMKVIKVYDRTTKATKSYTANLDLTIEGAMRWSTLSPPADSADGSVLFALVETRACVVVGRFVLRENQSEWAPVGSVSGTFHDYSLVVSAGQEGVVGSKSFFHYPAEIYASAFDAQAEWNVLTDVNRALLGDVEFVVPQRIVYAGADGDPVEAFVFHPAPNATQKLPVFMYVHGGPESPFGDNFHYRFNPEVIATLGIILVGANFHGTASYGDDFCQSIKGDWGGKPFDDCMRLLDALPTLYPNADMDNMCLSGHSYGGYLSDWINAHSRRFKCLVSHAGPFAKESGYYTTDELYFEEVEFLHPPYENNSNYQKFDSMNFVQDMATPTLITHGDQDFRVPSIHAYGYFTALQRRHIPSRLVVFPDENHYILKPLNSKYWFEEFVGWVASFLLPQRFQL